MGVGTRVRGRRAVGRGDATYDGPDGVLDRKHSRYVICIAMSVSRVRCRVYLCVVS